MPYPLCAAGAWRVIACIQAGRFLTDTVRSRRVIGLVAMMVIGQVRVSVPIEGGPIQHRTDEIRAYGVEPLDGGTRHLSGCLA